MSTPLDILGLGVVAVDELLHVSEYPPADTKTRVSGRERQCGGLTAIALITAARLGAKCAYAGVLGNDELSRFIRDTMKAEGVDMSHVVEREDARPVHSAVVVDETHKTRTIYYHVGGPSGADGELPADEVIRSAKVLLVDQWGVDGMIRAAEVARAAGRPVVADFESDESSRFAELLRLPDHLILPLAFAQRLTRKSDGVDVVKSLWREDADTVAVTCGTEGVYYIAADAPGDVRHQVAYPVETVDTTGCGDVFHGAYAFALARGLPVDERMRLAAAAAAMKATQPGGQKGISTLSEVETFLARREG